MRRPRRGTRSVYSPSAMPSSMNSVHTMVTSLPATRRRSPSARCVNTTTSAPCSRTMRTPLASPTGSGVWAAPADGRTSARSTAVTAPMTPPLMRSTLIEHRLQVHHGRAVDRLERPNVHPGALHRQHLHLVHPDRVRPVGGARVEDAL